LPSKPSGSVALRAHGPQIDRTVSPAAGVVDLRRRRAANLTDPAVAFDYLRDHASWHHYLPPGKSSPLQTPQGLAQCCLSLWIKQRFRFERAPELADECSLAATKFASVG